MDEIKRELEEVMRAVRTLDECLKYLSHRVAWNETCFKQVQDSGVMKMAETTRQVMLDHKRLIGQYKLLEMRVKSLLGGDDSGDQGGGPPPPPAASATSTRRFGP